MNDFFWVDPSSRRAVPPPLAAAPAVLFVLSLVALALVSQRPSQATAVAGRQITAEAALLEPRSDAPVGGPFAFRIVDPSTGAPAGLTT